MALGARDGVFLLLGYLMVLGCTDRMMVAEAQAPITCSLPSDSTISLNYCTYSDQTNTANQTTDCQGYLSDLEDSPSKLCCTGVNNVAYYKTACICMATFYPPATVNATRQLQLPRLCNVTTDLCGQCPSFIVAKTTAVPICKCTLTFANYPNLSVFLWRCVYFDTIFSFAIDRLVRVGIVMETSRLCRISSASSLFCSLKFATIFGLFIHYGQNDRGAHLRVYPLPPQTIHPKVSFSLWCDVCSDPILTFPLDRPLWVGVKAETSQWYQITPSSSPLFFLNLCDHLTPSYSGRSCSETCSWPKECRRNWDLDRLIT